VADNDWISAMQRLTSGRSVPDTELRPETSLQPWQWDKMSGRGAVSGQVDALPLGDPADPISQITMILAPMLRAYMPAAALKSAASPLAHSVVRTGEGGLQRLYHGTPTAFPDFMGEYANARSLYGSGVYMSDSPAVAEGYATQQWPSTAQILLEQRNKLLQQQAAAASKEQAASYGTRAAAKELQISADMQASPWAYRSTPNVRPVYADVRKPFDLDSGKTFYTNLVTALGSKEAANQRLQALGYDGLTHAGGTVIGSHPHRVYIAFSPSQVHSSFGIDAQLKKLR
jgi:hypothetical protein